MNETTAAPGLEDVAEGRESLSHSTEGLFQRAELGRVLTRVAHEVVEDRKG